MIESICSVLVISYIVVVDDGSCVLLNLIIFFSTCQGYNKQNAYIAAQGMTLHG